ncbi:hypothetical protein RA2_00777 [Roseovarius sp. A-2]|uniref:hypothetical protein n=1 Tax=Roseovarius sp. A-2 TaxID=1570360 RepID=UPI0009B554C8|nr:hypothetical protein [Roseovarius sp. A-2]GAW33734.1 hypothetical protein RA2_00777 [Roseovarius sp. A-2]
MINVTAELDRIQTLVGQDEPETRYRHEPQLRRAIAHLRAEGQAVPPRVKQLHQTLLSEAIEAEFDNMPV